MTSWIWPVAPCQAQQAHAIFIALNPEQINPDITTVLCDNWSALYGGSARNSHLHIERILQARHHAKNLFLDGDSKVVVPEFFAKNPEHSFEVIYVDGGYSHEGAMEDLRNVVDHFTRYLVVDAIYHPAHRDELLQATYDFEKQFDLSCLHLGDRHSHRKEINGVALFWRPEV